jgi:hypothetical protein
LVLIEAVPDTPWLSVAVRVIVWVPASRDTLIDVRSRSDRPD